jgi:hypothetical protein
MLSIKNSIKCNNKCSKRQILFFFCHNTRREVRSAKTMWYPKSESGRRMPHVGSRNCLPFWMTWVHPRWLVGFGIPMCTTCAPLLADLFLYSYEADFIQGLLKKNQTKLARFFNFTFRYIDDVLSLNNSLEYRIIWEIYTPYAGTAGMLLHINGKFTMGKLKSSLLS